MKEFSKVSVHNHFGGINSDKLLNDAKEKRCVFDFDEAFKQIEDAYGCGYKLQIGRAHV